MPEVTEKHTICINESNQQKQQPKTKIITKYEYPQKYEIN